MTAIDDIQDVHSFETWLRETNQPSVACIALAARTALRVLPLVWADPASSPLPFLRANLVASIRGLAPPKVLAERLEASNSQTFDFEAADAAYAASENFDNPTASFAGSAAALAARTACNYSPEAYSARTAYAASNAVALTATRGSPADSRRKSRVDGRARSSAGANSTWATLRSDSQKVADGTALRHQQLFIGTKPDWFDGAFGEVRTAATPEWSFWLDWYERMLEGREQNWPLLLEIATQDYAFWQGSDAEINAEIAKIVERHALADDSLAAADSAYPIGETIARDADGHYIAIPESDIPDDAFALAKRRARDAVDDMREDIRQSNHLRGMEKVARAVERELNRSADAPVLFFEALSRAIVDLQFISEHDDLISGDAYAEAIVLQYRDRLLESAYELRVHDPNVRSNHEAKAALNDKPILLPPTTPDKLRAIGQFVRDEGAGVLAEQMPEDAETVLDPSEPEKNRKSALARFSARVVKILILDRQSVTSLAEAATLIQFSQSMGLVDALAALIRMLLQLK